MYGQNLTFDAEKRVADMLDQAFQSVLTDYLEHTDEQPRLKRLELE